VNKQYWGKYQPAGISNGGEKQLAGRTLREMIAEARSYVELFLKDLENEEIVIKEPQEIHEHNLLCWSMVSYCS
jgi:hypothetical protein